jgi:hypothetical protein
LPLPSDERPPIGKLSAGERSAGGIDDQRVDGDAGCDLRRNPTKNEDPSEH